MSPWWKGFLFGVAAYLAARFLTDALALSASWTFFITWCLSGIATIIRLEIEKT